MWGDKKETYLSIAQKAFETLIKDNYILLPNNLLYLTPYFNPDEIEYTELIYIQIFKPPYNSEGITKTFSFKVKKEDFPIDYWEIF